jgi:hypothetical protein
MSFEFPTDFFHSLAEETILLGGAIMAIGYGLRRIYRMARNIETLVDSAAATKDSRVADATERKAIADTLAAHITLEETREQRMDEIIRTLQTGQAEILREIRPNGGSSIKDVVNQVQRDVAVLTQWKEDSTRQNRLL